jgi:hypothetical protein
MVLKLCVYVGKYKPGSSKSRTYKYTAHLKLKDLNIAEETKKTKETYKELADNLDDIINKIIFHLPYWKFREIAFRSMRNPNLRPPLKEITVKELEYLEENFGVMCLNKGLPCLVVKGELKIWEEVI